MAVLAHGRPLITTAPSGPLPEFQHGENMWLVPADDPAGLAESIRRLAADPALTTRLGLGARALAKSYRWDVIAERTAEFYAEITAGYASAVVV